MDSLSRGLLDTSVMIDLPALSPHVLPEESAISVATLAELHFGILVATNAKVKRERTRFVHQVESLYRALPIDSDTARTYALLAQALRASGRQVRRRAMDLLIAATAAAHGLPLYTRNPDDFAGLTPLVDVRTV